MKNSYKFFQNKNCKYFPCHKNIDLNVKEEMNWNCLFCFCPIFPQRKTNAVCLVCGPCEKCWFPHRAKNYERIIEMLKKLK